MTHYFVNKDKDNYILINEKLVHGKKIDWKNSIGTNIIGKYKGIDFIFNVMQYSPKCNSPRLIVVHEGKEKYLYPSGMKRFGGFDVLLGFKSYEFLYEIGQHIKDKKRDYIIIDRKKEKDNNGHTWKYYKIKCNKCGFDSGENYLKGVYRKEYWITEGCIKSGVGCACCSKQFCVTGINDMWTTNPEVAELLEDKDEGYKNCIGTDRKLNFKCPLCLEIRLIRPNDVKKYNKVTCICADSFSYSEKFIYSMLKQLDVDFIWQYTSSSCNWIKNKKKYDFYFKIGTNEYIIESHGSQHYTNSFERINDEKVRTLEEEQENDKLKYELAIKNGIRPDNYIVIDFRESTLEWGKEHILNSKLNKIFDLNNVDWDKCDKYTLKSKVVEVCRLKEAHPEYAVKDICLITGLGETSVRGSLEKGKSFKNIDYSYNPKKKDQGEFVKVETTDGVFIGNFKSLHELDRMSIYLFGRKVDYRNSYEALKKHKTLFNLVFTSIPKEQYYESEFIYTKYTIKNKVYKIENNDITMYFNSFRQLKKYLKETFNISIGERSFKEYLDSDEKWNDFYIKSDILSYKEQQELIMKGKMINGK